MISLLPKYEKNRVKKEYIIRFLTVASLVFSIFIISAIIPLILSSITIYYNIDFVNNVSKSIFKGENLEKMNGLLAVVKDTNRKIKILIEPIGKTGREDLVGIFDNIFKIADSVKGEKTNLIKINQISYEQVLKKGTAGALAVPQATVTTSAVKESGAHKIYVKGLAKSRENFISFLKKLEMDKNFISIDSPVSNLVESNDANFSITITLRDNKVI